MPKQKNLDELISLSEAAHRYGYAHAYLRQLAIRGRLKARKIGRDWLTTPRDMEAFIESRIQRGVYKDAPDS